MNALEVVNVGVNLKQADLQTGVQAALASKAKSNQELKGEAAVRLIQSAQVPQVVNPPHLGNQIDLIA